MKNLVLALLLMAAAPSPRILDNFDDVSRWKVLPSDGIAASISPADGGLRLDYDFQGRGGYAVVRREIPLDLPENYEFTFRIRGEGLPNTLEFKLVDPTKENVWWVTRRDFEPPLTGRGAPPPQGKNRRLCLLFGFPSSPGEGGREGSGEEG